MKRWILGIGLGILLVFGAGCAHVKVNGGIRHSLMPPSSFDISVSVTEVGIDPIHSRPDLEEVVLQELGAALDGAGGSQIENNDSQNKDSFDFKRKVLDELWVLGPEKGTVPNSLLPVGETGARLIISVHSLTTGSVLGLVIPPASFVTFLMGQGTVAKIDSEVIWALVLPDREVEILGRRKGNDLKSTAERRKLFEGMTKDLKRYLATSKPKSPE